ncbi:MAG: hypothetical protein LBQ37_02530 [Elusimicrobiota bacterium]|jgi:hypothetical protein|nr:hypothetical protein [Elusimicrobiota bacterium]
MNLETLEKLIEAKEKEIEYYDDFLVDIETLSQDINDRRFTLVSQVEDMKSKIKEMSLDK